MSLSDAGVRSSFEWLNVILDHGEADKPTRLVLLTLHTWMRADLAEAFPSQELIARRSGLSRKYVGEALRRAEDLGYLRIERRFRRRGLLYIAELPNHLSALIVENRPQRRRTKVRQRPVVARGTHGAA